MVSAHTFIAALSTLPLLVLGTTILQPTGTGKITVYHTENRTAAYFNTGLESLGCLNSDGLVATSDCATFSFAPLNDQASALASSAGNCSLFTADAFVEDGEENGTSLTCTTVAAADETYWINLNDSAKGMLAMLVLGTDHSMGYPTYYLWTEAVPTADAPTHVFLDQFSATFNPPSAWMHVVLYFESD